MNAENDDGQFISTVLPQNAGGKRNQTDQHKKQSVDVGEHRIHIFRVNGNKKMMRAPIGEKQRETQNIRKQQWKQFFNLEPEIRIADRSPNCRYLDIKNKNRHHDGKNAIR